MIIKKLTLEGYHNFHLRGIRTFVYTPEEKTQIVLGSNGSGKTSLLKELSPLPADHKLYSANGYKVVEIEHEGRYYILSSFFSPDGHRYLFTVDGEEQNPGESITVYRELVKSHFKYTQDVHDLLIDVVSFDMLDVAKRRALFMKMSDQDFTYAVKYFKRLSESARDLQGSIKLDKAKLVKESDKLLSPEDEQKVRQEIESVRKDIQILIDSRQPKLNSLQNSQSFLRSAEREVMEATLRLEKLSESLTDSRDSLKGLSLGEALVSIDRDLSIRSQEQSSLTALISHVCEQMARLDKSLTAIKDRSERKIDFMTQEIASHRDAITEIESSLYLKVSYEDARRASEQLPTFTDSFDSIHSQYLETPVAVPELGDFSGMSQECSIITDRLGVIETRLYECSKQLHTLNQKPVEGDVECPECHHKWTPGVDHAKIHELEGTIASLRSERSQREDRHSLLTNEMSNRRKMADIKARLLDLIRAYPVLEPLILLAEKGDRYIENLATLLRDAPGEMGQHLKVLSLRERIKSLQSEILTRSNAEEGDADALSAELVEVEQTLHRHQDRSSVLTEEIHSLRKLRAVVSSSISHSESLVKLHGSIRKALKGEVIHHVSGLIDEMITIQNLKLTSLERSVTTIDIQKGIVSSLEKNIASKETDHRLLKAAVTALSPTEGLIAKAMGGFINRFVSDINRFIEDFWLYPLALEPVDLGGEEVDLDYKFTVRVNGNHVVKDIQETSRGMREIINLAVRATCMKYLGLRNYPLFLDEFAARMDVAHRKAAYEAIDKLIESEEYSQIFLVSHYQEGYGALTDAEILVLCDSNVRMPKGLDFNKHVTMMTT